MRSVLLAIAVVLASPASSLAHSELRGSAPAAGDRLATAPEAIELRFNEAVQVTALRLFRSSGQEVALARTRELRTALSYRVTVPMLVPDAYRIEWRIISADGHPVGGTIRFTVESGS